MNKFVYLQTYNAGARLMPCVMNVICWLLSSTTLTWSATSASALEVVSVRAVSHYPAVTTISSLVITAACV